MRQIISLQRSGQPGGAKVLCYKRDGTPFWSAPACLLACLTVSLSVCSFIQLPALPAVCPLVCLFVRLSV